MRRNRQPAIAGGAQAFLFYAALDLLQQLSGLRAGKKSQRLIIGTPGARTVVCWIMHVYSVLGCGALPQLGRRLSRNTNGAASANVLYVPVIIKSWVQKATVLAVKRVMR